MTINNNQEYLNNLWDWGILRGCFGPTIEPTDIDGMVERNGKFLWLETKAPGVSITEGQRIALIDHLASENHAVVLIWGIRNNPQKIEIYMKNKEKPTIIEPATLDDLRGFCRRWYEWANETR